MPIMHENFGTMRPTFTVVFVVIKRVSPNLTGIRLSACIGEELVYKGGSTTECVIENRSMCGEPLKSLFSFPRFGRHLGNEAILHNFGKF